MVFKETRLTEIINKNEDIEKIFERYGLLCMGCPGMVQGTVEEAANAHDIDLDELLECINRFI